MDMDEFEAEMATPAGYFRTHAYVALNEARGDAAEFEDLRAAVAEFVAYMATVTA